MTSLDIDTRPGQAHSHDVSLEEFLAEARAWLDAHTRHNPETVGWGEGSDEVAIFRNETEAEEADRADAARAWQRTKFDAGFGAIHWPAIYGGRGLPASYASAFDALEDEYEIPPTVDGLGISLHLETGAIMSIGTDEQKDRWLRPLLRADDLCCQMFSEPGAGSDLGAIALRAKRDDDGRWRLNGQKVWTSAARYASLGLVIARTDPTDRNQDAFTAFVLPMNSPGITVRPLRQMTGGMSFNEVFFDDVIVDDRDRLGEVGAGWHVILTTLGYERAHAQQSMGMNRSQLLDRLVLTARHRKLNSNPDVRRQLGNLYAANRLRLWLDAAVVAKAERSGSAPGAEGSFSKLNWSRELQLVADAAVAVVGPNLAGDTGEWGGFAWSEAVTCAPGMRLGGGTDEIQKNTIAERLLGLPREKSSRPHQMRAVEFLDYGPDPLADVRQSVAGVAADHLSLAEARRLLEGGDYSTKGWELIAGQIGLNALLVPEDLGGLGGGTAELVCVFEELGRTLAPTPLPATTTAISALVAAQSPEATATLNTLLEQTDTAAIAFGDNNADVVARRTGDSTFVLDGHVQFVLDGHSADTLVVSVAAGSEPGLYVVSPEQDGVKRTAMTVLDPSQPLAKIEFNGASAVRVAAGEAANHAVAQAKRDLTIMLSASAAGAATTCMKMAVEYAQQRSASGRLIGQFQAVKHLLADLMLEVERTRTAIHRLGAEGTGENDEILHIAAAQAITTAVRAAADNIHVHGGIGFTWEHDAHLFYRRARAVEAQFGPASTHIDQIATIALDA